MNDVTRVSTPRLVASHIAHGRWGALPAAVGPALGRAFNSTNRLRAEHFFTSLLGLRVSTAKPHAVKTPQDALQAVLSDMTRKDFNRADVMASMSVMHDLCAFHEGANRTDNTPNARVLFDDELKQMSDLQLHRLHVNLVKHDEFLGPLAQSPVAMVLAMKNPTAEKMTIAGKLADFGHITYDLNEAVRAERSRRGFKDLPAPKAEHVNVTPDMKAVIERSFVTGGDVGTAVKQLRTEAIQAALHAARMG